jgi:eukaryotic-like serine/threonine-protein kinase
VDADREARVLGLALAQGLLRTEQVFSVKSDLSAGRIALPAELRWGPILDELIRRGALTEAQAEALEAEPHAAPTLDSPFHEAPTAEGASPSPAARPSSKPDLLRSGQRLGRYEIIKTLGQGGMGIVYKAFDPSLQRHVALKFILGDSPLHAGRFIQEARAQARVEHQFVCRVYEAGELEGRPFISMQYIEGKRLDVAAPEMALEEKLAVCRDVADALHAAHRLGLIHRDVKPGNVMVERQEDGSVRPYVTDFGLAREAESEGLTLSGTVVGTASYMAPEQARGETRSLDRRTDVYGLGATLYDILAGVPPFGGGPALETLLKVVSEDPEPLRKRVPALPRDVETIVSTCLEKEPGRRYESARALADDIQRFLDGEVIQARPSSVAYRVVKKVRKHRVATASVACAGGVALLFCVWGLTARWQAAQRAALAEHYGREASNLESVIRTGHLLPLHDTGVERAIVREGIARLNTALAGSSRLTQGPVHNALGRAYLALGEHARAREHLEAALNASPGPDPDLDFALGFTLANIYQQEAEAASQIAGRSARDQRMKAIDAELREPSLRHLALARGARSEAAEQGEALIALYERRYEEAIRKARAAAAKLPWLYEAKKLEGDIRLAQGRELSDKGQYEEALSTFAGAGEIYGAAAKVGQSDETVYLADAERLIEVMNLQARHGVSPAVEAVDSACDKALAANPSSGSALLKKARARLSLGYYRQQHTGDDPTKTYQEALDLTSAAGRLDPDNPAPFALQGRILARLADLAYEMNRDPSDFAKRSNTFLEKALSLTPGDGSLLHVMGNNYWNLGVQAIRVSADPHPALEKGKACYLKAIELEPGLWVAYTALGGFTGDVAEYELRLGKDTRPILLEAIALYGKALTVNPDCTDAYYNMATEYRYLGLYEMWHGRDPRPDFQKALQAIEKFLSMDPSFFPAREKRGVTELLWGEYEFLSGLDPSQALGRALGEFEAAAKATPNHPTPFLGAAGVHCLLAEQALSGGRSPAADLSSAEGELQKALLIDPVYPDALTGSAQVAIVRGRWASAQGLSPLPHLSSAAASLKRYLTSRPGDPDAMLWLAKAHRREAEWLAARRGDVQASVREGLQAADGALAANPDLAGAYAERGLLRLVAAGSARYPGARRAEIEKAAADLERAIEINPLLRHEYGPSLEGAKRSLRE